MAEATSGMVASGEKVSVGVGVCIDRVFNREREYHSYFSAYAKS